MITVPRVVEWWRSDRGSVEAEVAIVAPVLIVLLLFVGVVIHRGVDARIRIGDVAHQAARAASIEHSPAAATSAAQSTAARALSSAGVACRALTVDISTNGLRPGGVVRVTVSCDVDFTDAALLDVDDTHRLSATAVEPVDVWRSEALGFGITESPAATNPSGGGS